MRISFPAFCLEINIIKERTVATLGSCCIFKTMNLLAKNLKEADCLHFVVKNSCWRRWVLL